MESDNTSHEKRAFQRSRCRIACELTLEGRTYSGFLLDLSARGCFIQTNANAVSGTEVAVIIRPVRAEPIEVIGVVSRSRHGYRALRTVRTAGIGIEIKNAPESFFALVAAAQG